MAGNNNYAASAYCVCATKIYQLHTVKKYRAFAEDVVAFFGYRLIRFRAHTKKKMFFGAMKTMQYSNAKSTYFDEVDILDLGGFGFEATNIKGSRDANFFLDFKFHYEASRIYVTLVLNNDINYKSPFAQIVEFISFLTAVSYPDFLFADRMNFSKDVPSFVIGIEYEGKRNDFENAVASSISKCRHIHNEIPFLFAFNFIRRELYDKVENEIFEGTHSASDHIQIVENEEYVTITFPCCVGKELIEYPEIPEWIYMYRLFRDFNIINVTKSLDDMVEEISRSKEYL